MAKPTTPTDAKAAAMDEVSLEAHALASMALNMQRLFLIVLVDNHGKARVVCNMDLKQKREVIAMLEADAPLIRSYHRGGNG